MREIKFRAWDEKNQAMIYPKGIFLDGRVVNFMCGMLEPFDGYKLMQYTGLKDKNGREIYEGDVIKYSNLYVDGTKTWKVVLQKGCFGLRYKSVFIPLYKIDPIFMEVIGNIYENPKLLRKE